MPASPNVNNYYIGKGNVTFDGRHVGNVPEFEFTPTIETLEHFSSMAGVREKDHEVVIERGGTIRMVMEEWTVENLAMVLLGTVAGDTVEIFSENAVEGELVFTGANEVGQQLVMTFLNVRFIPGSSINPISDEWGQLEVTGEALTVGGSFGTVQVIDANSSS